MVPVITLLTGLLGVGLQVHGPDQAPVLEFPEPGLDDPAVYRDYRTRFYRDAHGNAIQIYLRRDEGRVVHLWANAANESVGFTARDAANRPASLEWGPGGATTSRSGRAHTITYRLRVGGAPVVLGWFLLGSMRVERDFQYAGGHLKPFDAPPYRVRELVNLVANLERLTPIERARHLVALRASSIDEVRDRLGPSIALRQTDTTWVVRVTQPSFDEKNRLTLELRVPRAAADVSVGRHAVTMRPRPGAATVDISVSATTDALALTPLDRRVLFNADFQAYVDRVRASGDELASRRLERQIRGLELVSYREKLMAGLPNFATYFGRDMMVTSLLMDPVWNDAMLEHVLGSVLRKLSPRGEVSHEEALGGQAIREHAAEYNALLDEYFRVPAGARADSVLARARSLLAEMQAVRENYHMVDDEFQLPVIAARYLSSPRVPAERKRSFLTDTARSRTSVPALALLLRNLGLVSELAGKYVDEPVATNLVGFPQRDDGRWFSGSWRDSGPGYANGRFAMDVNVIWVPEALASIGRILVALRELGGGLEAQASAAALPAWVRDSAALSRAVETWRGSARHFMVRLPPEEAQRRIDAKLAWLPDVERAYWGRTREADPIDTLEFLALSLDAEGRPIPVMNSDPALGLLLQDPTNSVQAQHAASVWAQHAAPLLRPFVLPYPVGLLVDSLGPLVANDAYASREVWEPWRTDLYHSPRVVWGREVNILLMALAQAPPGALRDSALAQTRAAVRASGLEHMELWSYRIESGRLVPMRYGTSSDVQLWNLTDLAVEFVLAKLGER